MTPVLDTTVDTKGVHIRLAANPKKGRAGKLKIKDADLPRNSSIGDKKFMSVWPWMKIRLFCKIIAYIKSKVNYLLVTIVQ